MLELRNICFEVQEEGFTKKILKNINLNIDNEKFVAITGPNGGGKSTLAKIISGIKIPTSGKIIF
ncbi:MAG: ATP-binding cassette domain-containing protein, partial [Clostridium neonatale]